ncbi:MAG: sigma-54 dependent transcriptional regulator [Kofleriaceae bacterium]
MTTTKILIADDDRALCEMLERGLSKRGFAVSWCTTSGDAIDHMLASDLDVIVSDLNMGTMNGLALCERIVSNRPDVPVIVITAFGSLETAIAAIRAGAYDFIPKPVDVDQLELALIRAAQNRWLREQVKLLRRPTNEPQQFEDFVGASAEARRLYELLDQVAATDTSVLITGESGTGKEVIARALHARRHPHGPFVAVNTAAIPEGLLESELFGHVRGAFTGAVDQRAGMFQRANGGTLFLDEIGDMPMTLQAKVLRALQERTVRPVGSDHDVPFRARVISATHHDLESDVDAGRFRQDLYFRLDVIHVEVPPLRSRGPDILLLAQRFISRFAVTTGKAVAGLSSGAAEKLLAYAWPGNVRELENAMERAVAVTRFEQVAVDDLPERIRNYATSHVVVASDDPLELQSMAEVERRYIARVLESVAGNKTLAARILGFDRKTLYNKLERYAVDKVHVQRRT